MAKKLPPHRQTAKTLGRIGVAIAGIALSFAIGIQTAGELHLHDATKAAPLTAKLTSELKGDFDGNGVLSTEDAIGVLEVSEKMTTASRDQIQLGDVNGDGKLTTQDALSILRSLADR